MVMKMKQMKWEEKKIQSKLWNWKVRIFVVEKIWKGSYDWLVMASGTIELRNFIDKQGLRKGQIVKNYVIIWMEDIRYNHVNILHERITWLTRVSIF